MGRGIKVGAVAAVGLSCLVLWAPQAGAAGFSDSLAGRETVSGLPIEITGSNFGATEEAGDPQAKAFSPGPSFLPAGHGVWVEWEATETGLVTISFCGSSIPLVLGVYHDASVGYLSEIHAAQVGHGADCAPLEGGFTFKALAGRKYELFVDGDADPFWSAPKEGLVSMRIEATPRPPNDDFADALALTGSFSSERPGWRSYSAQMSGYTWAATKEAGEPAHGQDAGGASVWYQWTAPESGTAQIGTGARSSTRFAVYRGESLGSLEQLLAGPEYGVLPVVGGTSYRIAIDGALDEGAPAMGLFSLSISMYQSAALKAGLFPLRDRQAPRTRIVGKAVRSRLHTATIRFRANEAPVRFRCKLDRRKARRCESPKTYAGLAEGLHRFKVTAVDAAGNADPTPATAPFSILRSRPHG